jgi:Na+/H+ antiporter NhaD/arsenite permease-like protein
MSLFLLSHKKIGLARAAGFLLMISLCFPLPSIAVQTPTNPTALPSAPGDVLIVTGKITDVQGKPLKDGHLLFFLNGSRIDPGKTITTSKSGGFEGELTFIAGKLFQSSLEIEAQKPSYKSSSRIRLDRVVKAGTDEKGNTVYLAYQTIRLSRTVSPAFWIATLILLAVYVLIAFELMHRTLASLLGAAVILFVTYTAGTFRPDYFILSFEDAMKAIDMNVIFLLMAMMIIVGVMKKTGVFQWLAYKSFQLAKGNIFALAAILMFVTAFTSAFLDNVTTMLLIIPVTIEIAVILKVNPVTLLLPEAFASNVGGTATLIGDPPNIMIGSYAKMTFVDFIEHLTLINAVALAAVIIYFLYWYKKDYLKAQVEDVPQMIAHLREEFRITNTKLLVYCAVVLSITIFLFIIHGFLHMEPSIAAIVGAALLLVISRVDIIEMLEKEIEWPTLIFFMMLFVVVAGAEETGLIQVLADGVKALSGGSLVAAVLMILWVSALASAIIDNIPFTATMLPVVAYLSQAIPGAQNGVLWWALSLGACLGGNGTMIGASANVVTVGLAEKAGYPISFMSYLKAAFVPMLITIVFCSFWLLLVEM